MRVESRVADGAAEAVFTQKERGPARIRCSFVLSLYRRANPRGNGEKGGMTRCKAVRPSSGRQGVLRPVLQQSHFVQDHQAVAKVGVMVEDVEKELKKK